MIKNNLNLFIKLFILIISVLIFIYTNLLFSSGIHTSGSDRFIPIDATSINTEKTKIALQIEIKKDKELALILKDKYAIEKAVVRDSILAEINGFRVQIYTTDDLNKAKAKIIIYNEMFHPENVKLDFDPPYFKIRIGNLRDRDEAAKFKEKLANMGFRNLIIIPAKVMVKIPK